MKADLCILIKCPPYGGIFAAEAIRHLVGAIANGLSVVAVLVGDGVWVAKAGQDPGTTGWTSLSRAVGDLLLNGEPAPPRVLAHAGALENAGLCPEDLMPGVIPVSPEAVAEALATARHVMIF